LGFEVVESLRGREGSKVRRISSVEKKESKGQREKAVKELGRKKVVEEEVWRNVTVKEFAIV